MTTVKIKEGETFDSGLKRFRRMCDKEGIMREVRARRFHEPPTAVNRRENIAARRRHLKKLRRDDPFFGG